MHGRFTLSKQNQRHFLLTLAITPACARHSSGHHLAVEAEASDSFNAHTGKYKNTQLHTALPERTNRSKELLSLKICLEKGNYSVNMALVAALFWHTPVPFTRLYTSR